MLTNDEIDRQVALIEGWMEIDGVLIPPVAALPNEPPIHGAPRFSREWHWCGPLVESYFISLYRGVDPRLPNGDVDGWVANAGGLWFDTDGVAPWVAWDEDPKRAACLSLIKFRGENRVKK